MVDLVDEFRKALAGWQKKLRRELDRPEHGPADRAAILGELVRTDVFENRFLKTKPGQIYEGFDFATLSSLSRFVFTARRRERLAPESALRWRLNNKAAGARFVAELGGATVPELFQGSPEDVLRWAEGAREAFVVKPVDQAYARGVFLAVPDAFVLALKDGERLPWSALGEALGAIGSSRWVAQRFLGRLAEDGEVLWPHDFRVHCFYGEIGFVRETCLAPVLRVADWTADGQPLDMGETFEPLEGRGVTRELVEEARRISLEIPVPYIRIDFLGDGDGFAFCEFTPHPGGVTKYHPLDQRLGDMFLRAEGRILVDLLAGKRFDTFRRIAGLP